MTEENFWSLYRGGKAGPLPLFSSEEWNEIWSRAQKESKAHPLASFFIRHSVTSDGTRWVLGGFAYGALVADFDHGKWSRY